MSASRSKSASNGFTGALNYTYPLKVVKKSRTELPEIDFSYFNPKKKKYITHTSKRFLINDHTDSTDIELIQLTSDQDQSSLKIKGENTRPLNGSKKSSNGNRKWILNTLLVLIVIGGFLTLWLFIRSRANKNEKVQSIPTSKEIEAILKEIDQYNITSDSNVIFFKMEECLTAVCCYLLKTDLLSVSRNEMFVLLIDKMDKENLKGLKNLFKELDMVRFSKQNTDLAIKDLKLEFNGLIKKILSKRA